MYIFLYITVDPWYGYYVAPPFLWDVFWNKTILIYINIHNKWIFICPQKSLGYKNTTVRLNVGPAKWASVLTGNYRIIKTVKAHYKMFAREQNYIANIIKAYFAVQHFTFAFPQFDIGHLCRNCIFLGFDNFFTKYYISCIFTQGRLPSSAHCWSVAYPIIITSFNGIYI